MRTARPKKTKKTAFVPRGLFSALAGAAVIPLCACGGEVTPGQPLGTTYPSVGASFVDGGYDGPVFTVARAAFDAGQDGPIFTVGTGAFDASPDVFIGGVAACCFDATFDVATSAFDASQDVGFIVAANGFDASTDGAIDGTVSEDAGFVVAAHAFRGKS